MGKGRRVDPGLKRGLIPPACDHQPRCPVVCGPEKLEALEAVLIVDGAGPCGKPAGKLVSAVGRHRDRVDLDDSHACDDGRGPSATPDRIVGSASTTTARTPAQARLPRHEGRPTVRPIPVAGCARSHGRHRGGRPSRVEPGTAQDTVHAPVAVAHHEDVVPACLGAADVGPSEPGRAATADREQAEVPGFGAGAVERRACACRRESGGRRDVHRPASRLLRLRVSASQSRSGC